MHCGPTHHYHTENTDLLYSPLNKICLQDFMLYCPLLRITKKEVREQKWKMYFCSFVLKQQLKFD
jgi:hypothetical protein